MFVVLELDQPPMVKLGMCLAAAYVGMQVPYLFLKNKIAQAPALDQARVSRMRSTCC